MSVAFGRRWRWGFEGEKCNRRTTAVAAAKTTTTRTKLNAVTNSGRFVSAKWRHSLVGCLSTNLCTNRVSHLPHASANCKGWNCQRKGRGRWEGGGGLQWIIISERKIDMNQLKFQDMRKTGGIAMSLWLLLLLVNCASATFSLSTASSSCIIIIISIIIGSLHSPGALQDAVEDW